MARANTRNFPAECFRLQGLGLGFWGEGLQVYLAHKKTPTLLGWQKHVFRLEPGSNFLLGGMRVSGEDIGCRILGVQGYLAYEKTPIPLGP